METITTPTPLAPERPAALDEKSLNAYRRLGYLLADLDPMNRLPPATAPVTSAVVLMTVPVT